MGKIEKLVLKKSLIFDEFFHGVFYNFGLNKEYVDIGTGEFMSAIRVANIVLRCWAICSSIIRRGDKLVISGVGYRISQLGETF